MNPKQLAAELRKQASDALANARSLESSGDPEDRKSARALKADARRYQRDAKEWAKVQE